MEQQMTCCLSHIVLTLYSTDEFHYLILQEFYYTFQFWIFSVEIKYNLQFRTF